MTNLKGLRVHPITSDSATYGYSYNISPRVKHEFFLIQQTPFQNVSFLESNTDLIKW